MTSKKVYLPPELTIHGNVEQITLAASATNADSPEGIADTAYPVRPR